MKYHLTRDAVPEERQFTVLTLCGRWVEDLYLIWGGASELVKDRYGCKSCLRIAGQKRQSHQHQEATQ